MENFTFNNLKMFSKRIGLVSEPIFQEKSISEELKNKLWNICNPYISNVWTRITRSSYGWTRRETSSHFVYEFAMYFSLDKDIVPEHIDSIKKFIKNMFFIPKQRNKIYDFIEFIYKHETNKYFLEGINEALEEENSAYRLSNEWDILPITNKEELETINNVQNIPYKSVTDHIQTAIKYITDTKPDYRNSIKESISAVEAMCCIITEDGGATLWKAIKKLKEKWIHIHPSLEQWFNKIYWYTSDDGGIRHSMIEWGEIPTFDEAKYMLVSCSAFVNYLMIKYEFLSKGK